MEETVDELLKAVKNNAYKWKLNAKVASLQVCRMGVDEFKPIQHTMAFVTGRCPFVSRGCLHHLESSGTVVVEGRVDEAGNQ